MSISFTTGSGIYQTAAIADTLYQELTMEIINYTGDFLKVRRGPGCIETEIENRQQAEALVSTNC